MEFVYDEEAVYQDADVLQAQYEAESRRFVAMQRAGFCMHSSWVGFAINPETSEPYYPEQIGLVDEQVRCTERCGRIFENDDELRHAAPTKVAYAVGDADTTPNDDELQCEERAPGEKPFICTRYAGHEGDHAAGDGVDIVGVWSRAEVTR